VRLRGGGRIAYNALNPNQGHDPMKKPALLVAGAALLAATLPSCASSQAAEKTDAPATEAAAPAPAADAPADAAAPATPAPEGEKKGEMSCGAGSCGHQR
jgi:hypothetical protein